MLRFFSKNIEKIYILGKPLYTILRHCRATHENRIEYGGFLYGCQRGDTIYITDAVGNLDNPLVGRGDRNKFTYFRYRENPIGRFHTHVNGRIELSDQDLINFSKRNEKIAIVGGYLPYELSLDPNVLNNLIFYRENNILSINIEERKLPIIGAWGKDKKIHPINIYVNIYNYL